MQTSSQGIRVFIFALGSFLTIYTTGLGQSPTSSNQTQDYQRVVQPFLKQHCLRCHNEDKPTSGVQLDRLTSEVDDRTIGLWDHIRKQVSSHAMPPEDEKQPSKADRQRLVQWIEKQLESARLRPLPKNGMTRRLTVEQYRNTLCELLQIEDDLTKILPAETVSRDGFINNKDSLQLSPLLLESYFEIAREALKRSIVDPKAKPSIQNFRVDLGRSVNPDPCPDELILGAGSLLLNNSDLLVHQLAPEKPFPYEPFWMKTKYRFHEGYQGNGTVRGWREFDSIYHAVFACMRGSVGYPKGKAYSTVPEGLLLRPAIPSAELFKVDTTMGPKANFKISLRELPDFGRFRVTVKAAKYRDGLLLDRGDDPGPEASPALVWQAGDGKKEILIPTAGIYHVSVQKATEATPRPPADPSKLADKLGIAWTFTPPKNAKGSTELEVEPGRLLEDAKLVESPFGHALSLDGVGDAMEVPRVPGLNVGSGDFTIAMWIHPKQLRKSIVLSRGKLGWTHGWYLEIPNNQGVIKLETSGPDNQSNGSLVTPPGSLVANDWQHVAFVARRGEGRSQVYVNGWMITEGTIGDANLDHPSIDLMIGGMKGADHFRGELDDLRIYHRGLDEAEIQALIEPGRPFVPDRPNDRPQDLRLSFNEQEFIGTLKQPSFLALRLEEGPLSIRAEYSGAIPVESIRLTPLPSNHTLATRLANMESRSPRLAVYLGLRRDCGSTLSPVGQVQNVDSEELRSYVFEGTMSNFPNPEVQKENDNYLAGVREIGVRSEYTDGREMPRLLIQSVEFEGPFYESWPPPSHRAIFVEDEEAGETEEYARKVLRSFATRAFRRSVSISEEEFLFGIYRRSRGAGYGFHESLQDALTVILTSPQFLFLIENSRSPEPERLSEEELASKLSYFLWNGPPDSRLMTLASSAELSSQLDHEVSRMIQDPRFLRFCKEFAEQWLSLDKFQVLEPDRNLFPKLTRDARAQLRLEPLHFLHALFQRNLSAKNLIESDFIMANEVVAHYYGLSEKVEQGFQFVPMIHRRRDLGGLLSQASIMAGLSDGRESNPVKRGAWMARKILAEPPEDPPPNVPALREEEKDLTLRERLERHRNQPGCAQCHSKIDPWGVPLEELDAGGRLKLQAPDARSTLPDQTQVAGLNDLKRYLAQDRLDQIAFCFAKHLTIYATGRSLSYNELDSLKRDIRSRLGESDYPMQDILRFVIHSPMFLEK